jgi:hypothetical protein
VTGTTGDRPVFIVGAPRSGTTLLRTLLDAHPQLAIAQETHWLIRWADAPGAGDLDDPDGLARFWSAFTASACFDRLLLDERTAIDRIRADGAVDLRGVFRSLLVQYAEVTGKPRWGEKTPAHHEHIDTLFDWFPDATVLFVVRDPRAVVNSHVTLPGRRFPADVEHIARLWGDAADSLERWSTDERVHRVRYESLAGAPEPELVRLCEVLGLPYAPEMVAAKQPIRGLPPMPAGFRAQSLRGSLSPRGAVSPANVERWRVGLRATEVAVIERAAGPAMESAGYGRSVAAMDVRAWARLAMLRLARRPRSVVSRRAAAR